MDDVGHLGWEVGGAVVVPVDGEGGERSLALGAQAAPTSGPRRFGDGSALRAGPPGAGRRKVVEKSFVGLREIRTDGHGGVAVVDRCHR